MAVATIDSNDSDSLFSGVRLRWSALTKAEKTVCLSIVLIPLLWLWGWNYLMLLFSIAAFTYLYQRGQLYFGSLPLFAKALIAYTMYRFVTGVFYDMSHGVPMTYRAVLNPIDDGICPALWMAYIKNNHVRTRIQVVAWSLSVLIIEMLIQWVMIYVIWHQGDYGPPRSIIGRVTGKSEQFVAGIGNSNFLLPYLADDRSIPGMVRYVFFFHGPEAAALAMAFVCLVALELKNRVWSIALFSGAFFLLLLTGTRSVWIALPVILIVRFLMTAGRVWGPWLFCTIAALTSFITLCIPPVTHFLSQFTNRTAEAAGSLRGDSTAVRHEIYVRTIDAILKAPDQNLLFGFVEPGETVLPEYAPAMIGTHSFYLGSLMYQAGLVGVLIFAVFWLPLIYWFYRTRSLHSMAPLMFLLVCCLTLTVMAFESTILPVVLLGAMLYQGGERTFGSSRRLLPRYRFN